MKWHWYARQPCCILLGLVTIFLNYYCECELEGVSSDNHHFLAARGHLERKVLGAPRGTSSDWMSVSVRLKTVSAEVTAEPELSDTPSILLNVTESPKSSTGTSIEGASVEPTQPPKGAPSFVDSQNSSYSYFSTLRSTLGPSSFWDEFPTTLHSSAPTVSPTATDALNWTSAVSEPIISSTWRPSVPFSDSWCSLDSTPLISQAIFSNSGSQINVHFTVDTNATQSGYFPCLNVLNSTEVAQEECFWSTHSVLTMYLNFNSSIIPGDVILVRENSIVALLADTICVTPVHGVIVSSPQSPPVPAGFLSGPQSLSNCTSYFSATIQGLTGSGGREFTRFEWNVYPAPSLAFDNLETQTFSETVSIPTSVFQVDLDYTVVYVENFFGESTSFSKNFSISGEPLPSISVDQEEVTIYPGDRLSLTSYGTASECLSADESLLEYTWSVQNYPGIYSLSKKMSVFLVDGYTFNVSQEYQLTVSVSQNGFVNSFFINIVVLPADPIAQILGPSFFLSSLSKELSIDASSSYDPNLNSAYGGNTGTLSGLNYEWSCFDSTQNESCTSQLLQFGLSSETLAFNTSSLGIGDYLLSVKVTKGEKSDSAEVRLTIIDALLPDIFIVPENQQFFYSPEDEIVVYGKVTASEPVEFKSSWAFDQKPLESPALLDSALTATSSVMAFNGNTSVHLFHLVIESNTLVAGSYSLRLYTSDAEPYSSGFSTVDLTINSPPTSGIMTVVPLSGTEWITSFDVQSSYWVDDSSDLPLLFCVKYLIGPNEFTAQRYSLQSSSMIYMLPSDPDSEYISLKSYVVDQWGASAETSSSVVVLEGKVNDTAKGQIVSSQITQCLVAEDMDCIYMMTGLLASTFSQVNCTAADDAYCLSLNRASCSSTDNSCGPCLDPYVGLPGDGTTPCTLAPEHCSNGVLDVGETDLDCGGSCTPCLQGKTCLQDSDCTFGECDLFNNTCAVPVKKCPGAVAECSGVGICEYYTRSALGTTLVDPGECTGSNLDCEPECICPTGYAGSACEFTEVEFTAKALNLQTVLFGIQVIAETVDPSTDSLDDLAQLIQHVSSEVELFGTEAALVAEEVLILLAEAVVESGTVDDLVFEELLGSLSNLQELVGYNRDTNETDARRGLISNSFSTDLVAEFSELWRMEMTPGKQADSITADSFSLVKYAAHSMDICDVVVSLPIETTAAALGQGASSLQFGSHGCRGLFVDGIDVFMTLTQFQSGGSAADKFEVALSVAPDFFSSTNQSRIAKDLLETTFEYQLLLQNNEEVAYVAGSVQSMEFDCGQDDWSFHSANCSGPSPSPVYVECFGRPGRWNVSCVGKSTVPRCAVMNATDPQAICTVASYSASSTLCQCSANTGVVVEEGLVASVQVQKVESAAQIQYTFEYPSSYVSDEELTGEQDEEVYIVGGSDWMVVAVLSAGTPFIFAFGVFMFYHRRKRRLIQPDTPLTDDDFRSSEASIRTSSNFRPDRFLSLSPRPRSGTPNIVKVLPQSMVGKDEEDESKPGSVEKPAQGVGRSIKVVPEDMIANPKMDEGRPPLAARYSNKVRPLEESGLNPSRSSRSLLLERSRRNSFGARSMYSSDSVHSLRNSDLMRNSGSSSSLNSEGPHISPLRGSEGHQRPSASRSQRKRRIQVSPDENLIHMPGSDEGPDGESKTSRVAPSDYFQQVYDTRHVADSAKIAPDTIEPFRSQEISLQTDRSRKLLPENYFEQDFSGSSRRTSASGDDGDELAFIGGIEEKKEHHEQTLSGMSPSTSAKGQARRAELTKISSEMTRIREFKEHAQNELEILRRELSAERKAAEDAQRKIKMYGKNPLPPKSFRAVGKGAMLSQKLMSQVRSSHPGSVRAASPTSNDMRAHGPRSFYKRRGIGSSDPTSRSDCVRSGFRQGVRRQSDGERINLPKSDNTNAQEPKLFLRRGAIRSLSPRLQGFSAGKERLRGPRSFLGRMSESKESNSQQQVAFLQEVTQPLATNLQRSTAGPQIAESKAQQQKSSIEGATRGYPQHQAALSTFWSSHASDKRHHEKSGIPPLSLPPDFDELLAQSKGGSDNLRIAKESQEIMDQIEKKMMAKSAARRSSQMNQPRSFMQSSGLYQKGLGASPRKSIFSPRQFSADLQGNSFPQDLGTFSGMRHSESPNSHASSHGSASSYQSILRTSPHLLHQQQSPHGTPRSSDSPSHYQSALRQNQQFYNQSSNSPQDSSHQHHYQSALRNNSERRSEISQSSERGSSSSQYHSTVRGSPQGFFPENKLPHYSPRRSVLHHPTNKQSAPSPEEIIRYLQEVAHDNDSDLSEEEIA